MLDRIMTVIVILLLSWFCMWGIVHEEKLIAFEERLSDKFALIIGRAIVKIRRDVKARKNKKALRCCNTDSARENYHIFIITTEGKKSNDKNQQL